MCDSGGEAPKPRMVTQQEYDATLAAYDAKYPDYKDYLDGPRERQNLADSMLIAPPPPPDLTNELVTRAASAQRLRQMMTQGVGLTGVMGLPTPTRLPGLGGA